MNRFLVLVLAVTLGSIGCSRSADTKTPTAQDTPVSPNGGNASQNAQLPNPLTQEPSQGGTDHTQVESLDRSAELHDVFEAVFRHQFKNNASGLQQDAEAYFLSIKDKDPSPEFLKRFAGHSPPVKKGSEFVIGKGLKFRIDDWEWKSDKEVEITGGYLEGNVSASGNRYTVVRKEGKWVVEDDTMEWIS